MQGKASLQATNNMKKNYNDGEMSELTYNATIKKWYVYTCVTMARKGAGLI